MDITMDASSIEETITQPTTEETSESVQADMSEPVGRPPRVEKDEEEVEEIEADDEESEEIVEENIFETWNLSKEVLKSLKELKFGGEIGFMKFRLEVEIKYFLEIVKIKNCIPDLNNYEIIKKNLQKLIESDPKDYYLEIKEIEKIGRAHV